MHSISNGKSKKYKAQDVLIAITSLCFGLGVLTISLLLLRQSIYKHKSEAGPLYNVIYGYPFKNSNWMKSSIPVIVISSFGVLLGGVQIMTSLMLMFIHRKYRLLGLVIWIGSHIFVFIFSVICFSLAISVKANEHKDSALFWQQRQFRSYTVHNVEGHVFCSLLSLNCFFVLSSVLITAASLNDFVPRPYNLPPGMY